MATITKDLTEAWSLLTASGFIGQKEPGASIEIRNDLDIPDGSDRSAHKIGESINLQFPAPSSGNWYGRVSTGKTTLVITEV